MEATLRDRRGLLVLDGLESEECAFRKGTLIAIRQRLMGSKMDHRLIERTIEVASQSAGIGSRALRVALESSLLCAVSRVEDTYNFLGHAHGSANSRWLGKPGCGNMLRSNMLSPMSDESKGGCSLPRHPKDSL